MDSIFMGYIAIAIGIFLGFTGIAVAIFFGLRAFRTDIKGELSTIKEKSHTGNSGKCLGCG